MDDKPPCRLTGYAYRHGSHDVYGGPESGGFIENIEVGALRRAVADNPTVPLRAGVNGPVIGTANLSVDDVGVKIDATLDVGISVRVKEQQWSDEYNKREITEVSIEETSTSALDAAAKKATGEPA